MQTIEIGIYYFDYDYGTPENVSGVTLRSLQPLVLFTMYSQTRIYSDTFSHYQFIGSSL